MPGKPGKLARVSVPLPEPPAGIAFVGYVRYSSEMQDADSIVTQKREITALAQRKGWILAAFYKEPEHSAKYAKYEEVSKRPVFSRVLEDARAGKITGILCYRNNRWSAMPGSPTRPSISYGVLGPGGKRWTRTSPSIK
jgi:hypothetical protein